jgi:hypothetical protein
MNLSLGRNTLCSCVAAAMLAACGGSQPPIGAPGAMAQTSALATHADRGKSWMAPDAAGQDLLYVTDVRTVTVYSYPQGKYEGTLRHFYIAQGECVDKKGDIFIADLGYYKVFEYAHGGTKRIATLDAAGPDPSGCAVDPTTGDLAVASLGFSDYGQNAFVAIYKNARGKPTTYQSSTFYQYWFCGYDNKGNLFVDGLSAPGTGHFALAKLPKGGSALKEVTPDQYIGWPGGVQWDGKHVAIGDQITPVIYQFSMHGSKAAKVGTTALGSGAYNVVQFFIDGQTVIAPDQHPRPSNGDVLFYNYPAGGSATKKITKAVIDPHGAVVSNAPQR